MIHSYSIVQILFLVTVTGATESGIVGGRVTKAHSRPYMASLQYWGQHSCGGILIREDYVLTAAHCKQACLPMTVVLGAHDINQTEESQQRIRIAKYYSHPKYYRECGFDIMLLKLENNATLNQYVKPLRLPKKDAKILANTKCDVAGWGWTAANGPESNVLREATEKLQFNFECKHIWREEFQSQHMICTTFDMNDGGICQGDSGGPLICNNVLQGITSYTKSGNCSDPNFPHVFTKISYFLPWIESVMLK